MKTTSRRRVLVSSVSMLLVSTLALGTATFAWFTNNKIVTADGMTVTSSAAQGLQITGKNGEAVKEKDDANYEKNEAVWGPTVKFTQSANLMPVSVDYSNDTSLEYDKLKNGYYPTDVNKTGAYKVDQDGNAKNAADFTGWKEVKDAFPKVDADLGVEAVGVGSFDNKDFYIAYEVGLRSTNKTISNVMLDVNVANASNTIGANANKYMRVAIIEQGENSSVNYTENSILTVIGNESEPNAVTALNDTEEGVTNPEGSLQETVTLIDQKIEGTLQDDDSIQLNGIKVGDVTGTPKYYTILVWFEGQDGECVDEYTNATGAIDLKFYYTETTTTAAAE